MFSQALLSITCNFALFFFYVLEFKRPLLKLYQWLSSFCGFYLSGFSDFILFSE